MLGNILDVGAEGTVQDGDVGAVSTVDQKDVGDFCNVKQKDVPAAGSVQNCWCFPREDYIFAVSRQSSLIVQVWK